ncbi:MAG: hypothetical protein H6581_06070 [Bacteroidia bacterium]|nr:hypothetical protein [Bacteroidia bacterium]
MAGFLYYPVFWWLTLVSLLPMPVLHAISSFWAFMLEHVIRYRFAVVSKNLSDSFPEKSQSEIAAIRRRFYRGFCDVVFETIKLMTISGRELKRRVVHNNPEVIPEMVAHGGGGIAIFAHYANWEWLGSGLGLQLPFKTTGIYKPLSNQLFDRLVLHIRTRLVNDMVPMNQAYRESLSRLRGQEYIAFLGDQNPTPGGKMYFTSFLGRPAAFTLGIATIAVKLRCPVWYFDIQRVKRGHYSVMLRNIPYEDLLDDPGTAAEKITDRHVAVLEGIIRHDPSAWLWSHRRWKHRPRAGDRLSETLERNSN